MDQENLVVFDIETTGIHYQHGHKIVEIAAINLNYAIGISLSSEISPAALDTKYFWHSYLNPMRGMPAEASRIHGITDNMLKDQPTFPQKADSLLEFLGTSGMIAHNGIGFDLPFLNHELESAGIAPIAKTQMIDTLPIAREKYPSRPNNLNALCRRFGIDTSSRVKHSAVLDCVLLTKVYMALVGVEQMEINLEIKKNSSTQHNKSVSFERIAPLKAEEKAHSEYLKRLTRQWGNNFMWNKN